MSLYEVISMEILTSISIKHCTSLSLEGRCVRLFVCVFACVSEIVCVCVFV